MSSSNKPFAIVMGANGFLGQNLCYWLTQNNYRVLAVGRKEKFAGAGFFSCESLSYTQVNLSVEKEVLSLPLQESDVIFMMAGQTGTVQGFSAYENYVSSNEIALLHLLSVHQKLQARARIVFPSSRLVYKGQRQTFLKEEDEKEAKTVYAANKIACENYLAAWANAYGIPYTVLRVCVPYGQLIPGNYSYGTLGFMLKQAKESGVINLYGDGSSARTFSHVADICNVMGTLAKFEKTNGETYNLGSKDNLTLLELANAIAERVNATVKFNDWPQLDKAIESGDTIFDDAKLQSVLSYSYTGNLKSYITSLPTN